MRSGQKWQGNNTALRSINDYGPSQPLHFTFEVHIQHINSGCLTCGGGMLLREHED